MTVLNLDYTVGRMPDGRLVRCKQTPADWSPKSETPLGRDPGCRCPLDPKGVAPSTRQVLLGSGTVTSRAASVRGRRCAWPVARRRDIEAAERQWAECLNFEPLDSLRIYRNKFVAHMSQYPADKEMPVIHQLFDLAAMTAKVAEAHASKAASRSTGLAEPPLDLGQPALKQNPEFALETLNTAHRHLPLPQSSSASRFTAGAFGYLNLSQSFDRPET
jgi:hypothetical protein